MWETWPILGKTCGKPGLFWKKLVGNWQGKPTPVSQETLTQGNVHFAEFTLHSFLPDNLSPLMLGVARHTFDPRAQQSAARTSSGWSYEATTGKLLHDDRWYGWPGQVRAQPGERIGLLLDLGAGSLTLYREGRLQGVLVSSGLAGLGPLCWSAELWGGGQELEVAQSEPPRSIVEL